MADDLQSAVERLAVLARSLTGMRQVPLNPPEQAGAFPFAVAYAWMGDVGLADASWIVGTHTFRVDVHCARAETPEKALPKLADWITAYNRLVLADPTLNGEVISVTRLRYRMLEGYYGGIRTLVLSFEVDVTHKNCLS